MSCPESRLRAGMNDDEFWAHVYGQAEDGQYEPEAEDYPELVVGQCLRCEANLIVEDYEQARTLIDADCELCDDCVDDQQPDTEETL